jgi:hypothetical protein
MPLNRLNYLMTHVLWMFMLAAICSCQTSHADEDMESISDMPTLKESVHALEAEFAANAEVIEQNKAYFDELGVQLEAERMNLKSLEAFQVMRSPKEKEQQIKDKIKWIRSLEVSREKVMRLIAENEHYSSMLERQLTDLRLKVNEQEKAMISHQSK